jgi:subtilase family serine protease
MRLGSRFSLVEFPLVLALGLFGNLSAGQALHTATRISKPIVEDNLTVLKGNTHPLARPEYDRGTAPPDLVFDRMLLVLRRSPDQEAALRVLLNKQQDRSSANFHDWLTPEQFGTQFGPDERDIDTIMSWLSLHGFQVNSLAKGRGTIEFSGTSAQVKQAFHTEIRKYEVNGEEHWANANDPQIPAALAPVVAGIASLHNFPRRPLHRILGTFSETLGKHRQLLWSNPMFTTPGGDCGLARSSCYAIAPYDLATIYNILPLWSSSPAINGAGQTIAIVAQSDIYTQDFTDFRGAFGLPVGTLNIIYDGPPPGKVLFSGDELESDLDVQWSGSVAIGATIDLVASSSTNTTAGVDLSSLYIVDNNIAPIVSDSYGACELDMGVAGNQFYNQLWQQAAAEGISVFVATGDSGAAVCDRNASIAIEGLSVNGISSTPYNIAVGGTDFDDLQDLSNYWNTTNQSGTYESAKGYIPESSWNDTCTNSEYFAYTGATTAESQCNDSSSGYYPAFLVPVGGSGGTSNCTTPSAQSVSSCSGGYPKPAWQSGPGVPADGKRDTPDVSLFSADGLNSSFYVACMTDLYGGCGGQIDADNLVALGGTSFAAPEFAGIMALINQKTKSRQGNANYVLYPLSAQSGASCNSNGTLGSSCIFYDTTTGTIAMPCTTGTPDCVTNNSSDQNGVLSGYSTNPGYDLATGLGSVNVTNLVNNWSTISFQPTTSTLTLSPTTQITHGSPVTVNVSVSPQFGSGTPSGQVSLITSNGPPAGMFTLSQSAVSSTTDVLPGGSYTVTAYYEGDGTFGASESAPGTPVTVTPESSTTTIKAYTLSQNGSEIPYTGGPYAESIIYLSTSVAGASGQGSPSGTVNVTQTVNGTASTLQGDPFPLNSEAYATTILGAYGGLQAPTPGNYSLAASYSGDNSFNASTFSGPSFTITQAPTNTTLSLCGNPVCIFVPGNSTNISATINYTTVGFNKQPSGTVTFYSNGMPLAAPATVDSSVIPPGAFVTINQMPLGPNNVTAQYSGDSNYLGSTSSSTLVEVGETFTITANPTTINITKPGQSGTTTLTFAAQNQFTGSATLTSGMCSNLPPESTCSFSPNTITFSSSTTSVPVTLTVATTASGSARTLPFDWPRSLQYRIGSLALVLSVTGLCAFLRVGRGRRFLTAGFAVIVISTLVACGGGSGSGSNGGGGGGGGNQGTPPGTYPVTVTVTINGVTQSISALNFVVQ